MRSSVPRPSHTESGFFEDAAGLGFGAWRVFVDFGRLWYFFGKCIGQKEREGHDGWMDGVHELVGILPCPAPPPPLPHVLELEDSEAIVLQRLCCQTCRARRLGQDASAPARGFLSTFPVVPHEPAFLLHMFGRSSESQTAETPIWSASNLTDGR